MEIEEKQQRDLHRAHNLNEMESHKSFNSIKTVTKGQMV